MSSVSNPFSLSGKSVLVTGASSGIGRATAIACAKLGAKVVITGRNAARLQATFDQLEGDGHAQILAELTSVDDVARLVASCPALNGLVLCAGIDRLLPLKFATPEKFAEIFGVNFNAPVELLRRLLREKKIVPAGSVVFVSSVAASSHCAVSGNAMYGASKAALNAAMRYFVAEYSSRRIRFNTVNPGLVNTPLINNENLFDGMCLPSDQDLLKTYPLGRLGEPDDIAHGIVYLLSDAASWVTGQQLVIDGGFSA